MNEVLISLVDRLADVVAQMDSVKLSGEDAVKLVAVFSRAENLVAAGRALATSVVLETQSWRGKGFQDPVQWIASNAGSPIGTAVGIVTTARALVEFPATRSAFVAGRVSQAQVAQIVTAAQADPSAEASLLEAVDGGDTYKQLHERCINVIAAAHGDEDAHERARRSRYFRHRFDGTSVMIDARLAPADAAPMIAYAEKRGMQMWDEARRSKRRESKGAFMADAITSAFSNGLDTKIVVNIHCTEEAFDRGHTIAGEQCEIEGVGPIPVSTARLLANKGYVKRLGRRDHDITRVKHEGRHIPAKLRSAIEARDRVCVVPGCDVATELEIDHVIPVEEGGLTCYENLARLCGHHHYLKTHHGYILSGKPGKWDWKPPPEGWKPKRPYHRN